MTESPGRSDSEIHRVVFLDFDGVLVCWDEAELSRPCVMALDRLLRESHAHVVVSSSWRERMDLPAMLVELRAAGFEGRLADVTPIRVAGTRSDEIALWLDGRDAVQLVVLDDEPMDARFASRQVRTDEYRGLTERDIDRALALFGVGGNARS